MDVCSEKLAESKMKHKSVRVCSDTPSESEVEQESVSARSDSPSEPTAEKESVDDVIKREIQEQLGDGPSVPLARMRIIIIVVLVLFILAFGIYFALVM